MVEPISHSASESCLRIRYDGVVQLLANQLYDARDNLFSKVFLRAFASHLMDDSRTTAGLPLAPVKLIRALRRKFRT